jgi:hypothetical protein
MKQASIIVSQRVWNPQSPRKKMFESQPSARELMFRVFRDSQCSVLEQYYERGTIVKSAPCSEILTDRLKPAIRSKCRELLSTGVVFLRDNACSHTAAHITEPFRKIKFHVMPQPIQVFSHQHLSISIQ